MNECYLCGSKDQISEANLARSDYRCNECLATKARLAYHKNKPVHKYDKKLLGIYEEAARATGTPVKILMMQDIELFLELVEGK